MEITVTATVGDRFLDEIIEGYSIARVFNSSIKLAFLGDSPQVFKQGMPLTVYLAASFHDGSTLPEARLMNSDLELRTTLKMRDGSTKQLETKSLKMSRNLGVWKHTLDMKSELRLEGPRAYLELNEVGKLYKYEGESNESA